MRLEQNENNHRHWRFIVNPAAGSGRALKKWPALEDSLKKAGICYDVVFTEKKLHAAELAGRAIAEGIRHLVAVGGDGTAHEVVNGIFQQTTCPAEEVTFTLLPIGTGNDWIKTHRIPKNSGQWLQFFQQGRTSFQDIGWMVFQKNGEEHKRYFLNVAGLSYDGYVANKADEYKSRVSNTLLYLFLVFRCLFQFKIPHSSILFDGREVDNKFYTINIGVCRYSGGGLQLVPHAEPNDGKLALTLVKRVSKLEVLLITPLFYLGKIGWHPAVSLHQAEEILVKSLDGQPVLAEADGEFLGETPVKMGILKNSLKIMIP